MVEMNAMENLRQAHRSGRTRLLGTLMLAAVIFLLVVGSAGAAPEKTPQFVNPLNGSIVEGAVKVLIFAPEYAQYNADFGVDNEDWRPMYSPQPGVFTVNWNSAEVSRGKHTLIARFTYGGQRPPVAAISITVWVNNLDPDGQAGLLPLPCIHVLKSAFCAAPTVSILPLPCIHLMGAYGLKPADCSAPATT